ncbi:MAG: WecB/TagA/CpsF family glycosyltransferase [Leptolyngbyaceae cyanobacterium]
MSLPTVNVTGTKITALPFKEQISTIIRWTNKRSSRIICVANVHMLMDSRKNKNLQRALENADLITPDGMPIVWVMRSLGIRNQDRVAGLDIFLAVCHQAIRNNVSIYLLGSTQDVLSKMKVRLKHEFPSLKLAGMESPPFRPLTKVEDIELIERINRSGAGITFISLGCPKQECWMHEHLGKINSVMIGVGAVFPVYAGEKRYAPKWIRESGLEWLYRLLQEPRRLFRRYLRTIPPFIWLALQQVGTQKKQRQLLRF